jgi:hypothetical protein
MKTLKKVSYVISMIICLILVVFVIYNELSAIPDDKEIVQLDKINVSDENFIEIHLSLTVAQEVIATSELEPELKGGRLSSNDYIVFYDLEGNPRAYVFKIIKNGMYTGYVTIGASFTYYPVSEYSTATFPSEYLNLCRDKAKHYLNDELEGYNLLYFGGGSYYANFVTQTNDSIGCALSKNPRLIPMGDLENYQFNQKNKAIEKSKEIQMQWDNYRK